MPDPSEPSSPTSSSKNVFRYQPAWNPTEDGVSSIGYSSRKALPIKKPDAHWLTREDVQFDLLDYIFNDRKAVFSTPVPGHPDVFDKVSFGDLYIHAIYSSPKCSKVIKDKMMETPAFAIELGKVSLLTNIGRINTTMAFFPEMKTALRTYHPLPSLQKTDGNLTDAPRLKTCLKAALLPSEIKSSKSPSTPQEIVDLIRSGQQPPTSVVNLIFVLATHYAHGSKVHFDGVLTILDLFLPKTDKSAASRAQAFLWLMFHYLEGGGAGGAGAPANPFDDDLSRAHPGKAPALRPASQHERLHGDHDTDEEIRWGKMMANRRLAFLEKFMLQTENDRKWKVVTQPSMAQDMPDQTSQHVYDHDAHAFTPISRNGSHSSYGDRHRHRHASGYPPGQGPRSMLEQAWIMIHNTSPLEDSGDEGGGGGGSSGGTTAAKYSGPYLLEDYEKRLAVLKRLRGKSPTPEPTPSDKSPMNVDGGDLHRHHQQHRPMDVDDVLTIRHHNPHQQSTTSAARRGNKLANAAGTTTTTGTRSRRSGGAKKGGRAAVAHAAPIEIVDS